MLLLACAALTGCGGEVRLQPLAAKHRPAVSADATASAAHKSPFRFFSPKDTWNKQLPRRARIDPNSAALVGELDAEFSAEELAGSGPSFNTVSYSVPIYTVSASQPTVRVVLNHSPAVPALQAAWDAVPLPATAQPAAGSDGHLVVWQPSTDRMWEFWRLVHGPEGWSASWGGAMQHVSSNPGVYGPKAWPGASLYWGGSASSLSTVGGVVTLEDLELGVINHALAMALPEVRAGVYSLPAHRSDGRSSNPLSLPEGAHLRLDPHLDLAALHLPRLTLLMAEAAQRYGIYVIDGASNVAFYGQDPTSTGTNPYLGPNGYFQGQRPPQLLASFPWKHLHVLSLTLHRNGRASQGAGD